MHKCMDIYLYLLNCLLLEFPYCIITYFNKMQCIFYMLFTASNHNNFIIITLLIVLLVY